ncbi:MAG: signal peptidase II [Gemmatimonadaceae bacterium]
MSDTPVRPSRFLSIVLGIVVLDAITKLLAVDRLSPAYVPHPVFGDAVRLTLVYNPGAAFGLHLGPWSRWIFTALTLVALAVLWRMYRASAPGERTKVVAIAMVAGGAIGNLVDRLRSSRGVVDFLDVGVGAWRWPTFNVADIAVSCGAVLLAIVLWREEDERVALERLAKSEEANAPATR